MDAHFIILSIHWKIPGTITFMQIKHIKEALEVKKRMEKKYACAVAITR